MNNGGLSYRGKALSIYHTGDMEEPQGPHIRTLLYTNRYDYKEVGSNLQNAPRDITGYYQVGIFIPTSDKGIDCTLCEMEDSIDSLFRRSSFSVDGVRMQYLDTECRQRQRVDGYYVATCLINFTAYQCIM